MRTCSGQSLLRRLMNWVPFFYPLPWPILAEAHSPTDAIECLQVSTEFRETLGNSKAELATLPLGSPSALANNNGANGLTNAYYQRLRRTVLN